MTFDQWWEENWAKFMPGSARSAQETRKLVAACWNEALCEGRIAISDIRKTLSDYYSGTMPEHFQACIDSRLTHLKNIE